MVGEFNSYGSHAFDSMGVPFYWKVDTMTAWILGIVSAWHGGRIHGGDPKFIKNLAWCLPFAVAVGIYCPVWTLVFVPLCYLKTMGHGRGFRLKEPMKDGSTPDSIERYLILPLLDKIPLYWYKVLLMSLVGLAAVSGGVIAFSIANPLAGLCVALAGLWKGVNAMIFDADGETGNAVREFADGCAAGCGLLAAIMIVS